MTKATLSNRAGSKRAGPKPAGQRARALGKLEKKTRPAKTTGANKPARAAKSAEPKSTARATTPTKRVAIEGEMPDYIKAYERMIAARPVPGPSSNDMRFGGRLDNRPYTLTHSFAAAPQALTSVETLGAMVRRNREMMGLSQQSFADLAGVGRRFVSELENGKPSLEFDKVLQVARAAGIDILARPRR